MKWKASFRKLTALLLSVVLMLSLCTTAFATEGEGEEGNPEENICAQLDGCSGDTHAEDCPSYQEPNPASNGDEAEQTPPACDQTLNCPAAEHDEGCLVIAVKEVQTLIDALPDAAGITQSNAQDVKAKLDAIDAKKGELSQDQQDALICSKYEIATEHVKSLLSEDNAPAESTPVDTAEPTPVEKVQQMINALQETVTAENAEDVKSQLAAIDTAKAALTDEELASLDITKYAAVANALGSYYENMTLNSVAQIGGTSYSTVTDAINAIVSNSATGTIDIIASTSENVVIPAGANITLNLSAGVTLTNDPTNQKAHTITNKGILTITGSGTVDNISHGKGAVYNDVGASATLSGCSYTRSQENGQNAENSGGNSWYNIKNYGTMTINAGVTVTQSGQYSSLIANGWQSFSQAGKGSEPASSTEAKLTINGGTFSGGLNTIKNDDFAVLVINDGSFINVAQYALMNWNVATINGGTFETKGQNNSPAVWCGYDNNTYNKGILTITAGTFTAANNAESVKKGYADATVTITGGTYSSDVSAYISDGYATTDTSGNYIVGKATTQTDAHVAVVDGQYFKTLEAAIAAAADGGTITLLKAVEENVTIAKDANVTLDLNGQTLTIPSNSSMSVLGTLTIQDSQTGGTIAASSKTNGSAIEVKGGKVTLESGKIENSKGYGISASDDGTANIHGGTIESLYAPLTGNNTTGNMNFEVNGGTLTAKEGPAIYMPGQQTLTITGGTLNGGISLRMGQINISGGTINAAATNLDSPADYYNYSGNAWLPDALYVFGGTYTSNDPKYSNSLNLNITGGTFNCANGQGSGIAIYDLGKTSQNMNVTVSGSAVVKTNATARSAYQVLSLSDIGVTSPAAGYGNANNVGKVATAISGGTFSSAVADEYCAKDFHPNEIKNTDGSTSYGVHQHEGKWTVTLPDCTKEGSKTRTCTICGTVETEKIPASTDHEWETDFTVDTPATCTTKGSKSIHCKKCDVTKEVTEIPVTDHSYGANWISDAEKHWHACENCGDKKDEAVHTFQWVVDKDPTVTQKGSKHEECTVCGYKKASVEIPMSTNWDGIKLEVKANRTSVRPGKTITYTLTVTNNTGTDLTDIVVCNTVDKNLSFNSSNGTGTYTAKDGLWTIPELKAGKAAKITVKYTVKSGVKDGTSLVYSSAITDAEGANGESLPGNVTPSGSVTVKVSNKLSLIPATGDTSNIRLWITVLAVALVALIVVGVIAVIKTRKKK